MRKNYKKAVEYFLKASSGNISESTYYLAKCYEEGKGVAKNHKKAIELYKKAVYQDKFPFAEAQFELAKLYCDGNAVKRDTYKAFELFFTGC